MPKYVLPDKFVEELEAEIKKRETWRQDDLLTLIDRIIEGISEPL